MRLGQREVAEHEAQLRAELPLQLLSDSFKRLKEQIDARDDFLTKRGRSSLGLTIPNRSNNGS
jgi:hypothetical protein